MKQRIERIFKNHRKARRTFTVVYISMLVLIFSIAATLPTFAAIPQNTYKMDVVINSRAVLDGYVYSDGNATYVPFEAFSSWLGVFKYSYNYSTKTKTLTGNNLTIRATAGKQYIEANGRYFYTGADIQLFNGEIYVPIRPFVKALNCHIQYNSNDNCFYVRSGDTSLLLYDAQVYNNDSVYWLSRIIEAEAGSEPFKGKLAVGNVVLNRVRSNQYPNSIYGVIFDTRYGVQFSPVSNGTIYNTPDKESIIAAKACLEGYSLSSEILYFQNPRLSTSSWITKNRPFAFSVGKHDFYK